MNLEDRLLEALESLIVAAHDQPVDTPTLDHPGWGPLIRLCAEARGEDPMATERRLQSKDETPKADDYRCGDPECHGHTPNAETIEAIREADAGGGVRYASAAEMFEKLGIDFSQGWGSLYD